MVIKQKWVSMLFYSNRKAHPFSISDVPIYKSIFHLLQAPPVTVYKPLFFNVSSTILMTAHICKGFRGYCDMLWNYRLWQTRAELGMLLLPVSSKIGSKRERVTTNFFIINVLLWVHPFLAPQNVLVFYYSLISDSMKQM